MNGENRKPLDNKVNSKNQVSSVVIGKSHAPDIGKI